jgi:hypothetical protein
MINQEEVTEIPASKALLAHLMVYKNICAYVLVCSKVTQLWENTTRAGILDAANAIHLPTSRQTSMDIQSSLVVLPWNLITRLVEVIIIVFLVGKRICPLA